MSFTDHNKTFQVQDFSTGAPSNIPVDLNARDIPLLMAHTFIIK